MKVEFVITVVNMITALVRLIKAALEAKRLTNKGKPQD